MKPPSALYPIKNSFLILFFCLSVSSCDNAQKEKKTQALVEKQEVPAAKIVEPIIETKVEKIKELPAKIVRKKSTAKTKTDVPAPTTEIAVATVLEKPTEVSIPQPKEEVAVENVSLTQAFSAEDSMAFFKKFMPPVQTYTLNPQEDEEILCEEGTMILISENSFVFEDGTPVTSPVRFEVKEFYDKTTMLLSGLTTQSKDGLLESGGMLYLSAESNGKKVNLSKEINIMMPLENTKPTNQNDMQIYVAESSADKAPTIWTNTNVNIKKTGNDDSLKRVKQLLAFSEGNCSCIDLNLFEEKITSLDPNFDFNITKKYNSQTLLRKKFSLSSPAEPFLYHNDSLNKKGLIFEMQVENTLTDYYLYEKKQEEPALDSIVIEYEFDVSKGEANTFNKELIRCSQNMIDYLVESDLSQIKENIYTRNRPQDSTKIGINPIVASKMVVKVQDPSSCSFIPKYFNFNLDINWYEDWQMAYKNGQRKLKSQNISLQSHKKTILRRTLYFRGLWYGYNTESYYDGKKSWITQAQFLQNKARAEAKERKKQEANNKRLLAENEKFMREEAKKQARYDGDQRANRNASNDVPNFATNSFANFTTNFTPQTFSFVTRQLGWINCDRFMNVPISEKVDFVVRAEAPVRLIFKSYSSLMEGQYYKGKASFPFVPIGQKIIAFSTKKQGKQLFLGIAEGKVGKEPLTLQYNAVTEAEMENILREYSK